MSTLESQYREVSAKQCHVIVLAIFTALATGFTVNSTPLRSANDRSRWSTVWSLVERGTYQIDEIQQQHGWQTIDKARHRISDDDDWHYYSTKPPLGPTLVAGVYYAVRKVTGFSLFKRTTETTRIILILVNVLPMLLALCLLSRMLLRHCNSSGAGVLVLSVACFGTLLTPFLTTLNNHTIAATAVLFTIYFASRILIDGSRSPLHFALAGLFAMWTCCNELPAALFGLTVFVLLFRVDSKRTLTAFAPAALIPLAGFFVANYAATGGWKPLYMYYGTDRYVYTVDGIPSYWSNPRGLDANQESPATYLFHCVFGHHGILSLTPVFLLSLLSLLSPRSWKHPFRPFLLPVSVLTVAILGFYLSRTQNYNYGGSSAGLRWAFWLIPLWLIAMVPLIERGWNSRMFRTVVIVLTVLSVTSAATALHNPWSHPWLYNQMRQRGLVNYTVPTPDLGRPVRSWLFKIPTLDDGQRVQVKYHNDQVPTQSLTLTARRQGQEYALVVDAPSLGFNDQEVSLEPGKVCAGMSAVNFVGDAAAGRVIRFLDGVPANTAFLVRGSRYIRTSIQPDALACTYVSGTVYESSAGRRHRCDAWVTEDVPFGTVMFQSTVADIRTNEILQRQTWKIASIEHRSGGSKAD